MTTATRKRWNHTEGFWRVAVALAVAPRQGVKIIQAGPARIPVPAG